MPFYDYACVCGWTGERAVPVAERDEQDCLVCDKPLQRQLAAPLGRMAGKVTPGGGPDRFTADMLGIPLKELPPGLKTK